MATYLLTWNPEIWDGDVASEMSWSCGQTKRIVSGDRLFIMRQSREPRGICGSGWAVSNVIPADSDEYVSRLYVKLRVDMFRDPMTESILTREELKELNSGVDHPMKWDIQSSGTAIPVQVAQRLELAWQNLCGTTSSSPVESTPTADFDEYILRADQILSRGNVPRPVGIINPQKVEAIGQQYCRDPHVRAWVLQRAKGNCELCNEPAPFVTENEEAYLESHHLVLLANGGPDTPDNCAALCPNCHRKMHYSKDRFAWFQQLTQTISIKEAPGRKCW